MRASRRQSQGDHDVPTSRLRLAGALTLIMFVGATAFAYRSWVAGTEDHPDRRTLARALREATEAIRGHQKPGGYWLTSYTARPTFQEPAVEVNTFVPALIADLLDPVAREVGLADVVDGTHRFLRDQIEPTGLLRYHGRPGANYITPFSCVITPDSDTTALAWRLAPAPDSGRLRSALRVLGKYRTGEGLYRTWLAAREAFECLDPGRDPNPPDVGINMHLYLFFVQHDPPAAPPLCEALRRTIEDSRIWVYYAAAPLVPLLREGDLAAAGCSLRVPASRLAAAPAGQRGYLALVRLLRALARAGDPAPSFETVVAGLTTLAAADFAELRRTPPLLYHNDFTATVPRFYWSEDVGYALWLRFYLAAVHRWPERLPAPGTGPA